jgi:hypothetical protein
LATFPVSLEPLLPAGEGRDVLAGEDDAGRAVVVLEDRVPAGGGLVGVGRRDHVEAGDRAQRGEVLDRLVGRAVLAEADGVVGPDVGDRQPISAASRTAPRM